MGGRGLVAAEADAADRIRVVPETLRMIVPVPRSLSLSHSTPMRVAPSESMGLGMPDSRLSAFCALSAAMTAAMAAAVSTALALGMGGSTRQLTLGKIGNHRQGAQCQRQKRRSRTRDQPVVHFLASLRPL